jgi:hypothetical protein
MEQVASNRGENHLTGWFRYYTYEEREIADALDLGENGKPAFFLIFSRQKHLRKVLFLGIKD